MKKVFALLFAASLAFAACQSNTSTEEAATDTTTTITEPAVEEPVAAPDTMSAAPAEVDTNTVTQ